MYTIDQIENIYWGLVGAYQDERGERRRAETIDAIASDDQKQLEIGTLAPLDVVRPTRNVASDKQALIAAKTKLDISS